MLPKNCGSAAGSGRGLWPGVEGSFYILRQNCSICEVGSMKVLHNRTWEIKIKARLIHKFQEKHNKGCSTAKAPGCTQKLNGGLRWKRPLSFEPCSLGTDKWWRNLYIIVSLLNFTLRAECRKSKDQGSGVLDIREIAKHFLILHHAILLFA